MATINEIMALVEKYPNDMELGEQIRQIYWQSKGLNEVVQHDNQLKMFSDNEILKDVDGDIESVASLGQD